MRPAYLVVASTGSHADKTERVIAVYLDPGKAQDHVDAARKRLGEVLAEVEKSETYLWPERVRELFGPLDPGFVHDYDTGYSLSVAPFMEDK